MEDFSLTLDPRLGLGADEVAAAWNADASTRAVAEARCGQPTPGAFIDPVLAQGLVSLAVAVVGGLTKDLVLDFIRARLKAKGKDAAGVEVEQRELPTGERVLVVRAGKA